MASKKGKPKKTLPELRVVLIGKTGAGKSTLGNALLGTDSFVASNTATSVTTVCNYGRREVTSDSRKYMLKVIDTPGLMDSRIPNDETCVELIKCISLSLPGPHFFVIVIQIGRFTDEENRVIQLLKDEFGHEFMNFCIVVFTHGAKLNGGSIEDYIKSSPETLQEVVEESHNRYAVIGDTNTKDKKVHKSVQNIIDLIVNSLEYRHYTNSMFQTADENKKEIVQRLEEEKNREVRMLQEELEDLKRRERDRCSKEEKKQILEEKKRKEESIKEAESKTAEEKYDDEVASATDDGVLQDTFTGAVLSTVGGIITTGFGFLTGNAVVVGQGIATAAKSITDLLKG